VVPGTALAAPDRATDAAADPVRTGVGAAGMALAGARRDAGDTGTGAFDPLPGAIHRGMAAPDADRDATDPIGAAAGASSPNRQRKMQRRLFSCCSLAQSTAAMPRCLTYSSAASSMPDSGAVK
jgi:hypothetical protein